MLTIKMIHWIDSIVKVLMKYRMSLITKASLECIRARKDNEKKHSIIKQRQNILKELVANKPIDF
jgi:hypothetical protein